MIKSSYTTLAKIDGHRKMIHQELWHKEALERDPSKDKQKSPMVGEQLRSLLREWQRGEKVEIPLLNLMYRLGFPPSIPQGTYQDFWEKSYGELIPIPEVQEALPGLFNVAYPNFLQELWKQVGEWDPRDLKRLFENDRHLQNAMEMDEGDDVFDFRGNYEEGFFDAVEFVNRVFAPVFESVWDQYQRRKFVSSKTLRELQDLLKEYNEKHRGPIEDQMRASGNNSATLNLSLTSEDLLNEYSGILALLDHVDEFPKRDELATWAESMYRELSRMDFRHLSAHQIRRIRELQKEWEEKWTFVVDEGEQLGSINRWDYVEEPAYGEYAP